jgi:hypothetical protein
VPASITVIIPTLCSPERHQLLLRAIDSVRQQSGVSPIILVVANGNRVETDVFDRLLPDPAVRVVQITQANLPAAQRLGRMLVRTEAFSFLDDDDVLLPGALRVAVDALFEGDADLVATNGFRHNSEVVCRDPGRVNRDPIGALLAQNWLASCAGVFRSASIGPEFFDGETAYNEWTLLAFKIANSGRKIRFVDVPTYRISDTPFSAYKTESVERYQMTLRTLRYLYEHCSIRHRSQVREHLICALHSFSDYQRARFRMADAWACHLRSLLMGGWRHLPYTRHLVRQSMQTQTYRTTGVR